MSSRYSKYSAQFELVSVTRTRSIRTPAGIASAGFGWVVGSRRRRVPSSNTARAIMLSLEPESAIGVECNDMQPPRLGVHAA